MDSVGLANCGVVICWNNTDYSIANVADMLCCCTWCLASIVCGGATSNSTNDYNKHDDKEDLFYHYHVIVAVLTYIKL